MLLDYLCDVEQSTRCTKEELVSNVSRKCGAGNGEGRWGGDGRTEREEEKDKAGGECDPAERVQH